MIHSKKRYLIVKLIVGLGNPGSKYDGTRHNIGFEVVDALAARFGEDFRSGKGEYDFCKTKHRGEEVLLVKPTTYMNLSGKAVRHAMAFYKISILDILVICDDFNLPLGAVRIRPSGTDGGQNGLKNIIQLVGRNDFARLRVGIGAPKVQNASSFVLGKFGESELPIVEETARFCADAACSFLETDLSKTMTKFNRKAPEVTT
ncbi:Aminoacyl-tRNA hydrolase [Chloroherpeton thalassium ATCC 35110]|uniref:Peptidyl-tRNA hydrolase n=1 Tax=Chloroherpeton thalassium (strain ATCC 35110 / GB-78) TaxID=517418 RepID=B3QVV2_CHLT3|nr:aminoacyl-tRNA hydrolase [Chloroherpeton thalassium]ACF13159.1 Aminoacyl-tRNA hydrolase [Chloroherpeton thalassium ATCC 35110]